MIFKLELSTQNFYYNALNPLYSALIICSWETVGKSSHGDEAIATDAAGRHHVQLLSFERVRQVSFPYSETSALDSNLALIGAQPGASAVIFEVCHLECTCSFSQFSDSAMIAVATGLRRRLGH